VADNYTFKSTISFSVAGSEGLRGAAKDVRAVNDALDALGRQRKTATVNAYETLGLRDINKVRADVVAVNAALRTLRTNGAGPNELARASAAAQAKLKALNEELRGSASAGAAADGGFKAAATRLAGLAAAAFGVREALEGVRSIINSGLDLEKQQAIFSFGSGGDAEAAAAGFEFARSEADRLGLSINVAAEQFAKLTAAARGTSLEGEAARQVFRGIAEAASAARLSNDDFAGIMLATNQIINKGTVYAEELRGQFGERLPGAFKLAAQAMNVTEMELGKLLENGQVSTAEFLPKFAEALSRAASGSLAEATSSTQAQLNRMANAFEQFKQQVAKSGLFDAMNAQIEIFLAKLKEMQESGELQEIATGLAEMIGSAVTFLGELARVAVEFRDEIKLVVEAVVGLKVVKTVFGGVQGLNLALGAAGTVAPVAAAGLNAVALALRGILPLALAVGAITLASKLKEIAEEATASERALAAWRTEVEKIAQANSDAQGEVQRSANELAMLSDVELAEYRKRIEAARAFYEARGALARESGQTDTADYLQQQAEAYASYNQVIQRELDFRLSIQKQFAQNTAAVQRGMVAELTAALAAEKATLKKANADLAAAVRERQAIADLINQTKAAVSSDDGAGPASLTELSRLVTQAEAAASQAANLGGDAAVAKAKEAQQLIKETLQGIQEVKREDAQRERPQYNKGDFNYLINRLESAAKKAADADVNVRRQQQATAEANIKAIEARLEALEKPITLALQLDPANLDNIRAALEEKLRGITVTVDAKVATSGDAAGDAPQADVPQRAFGGWIPGVSPSDRADNVMVAATAGEYMIQRPTTRYYGGAILSAFNAGAFSREDLLSLLGGVQRRAYGGPIESVAMPALSNEARMPAPSLRSAMLTVPGLGSYPIQGEVSVIDAMEREFYIKALAAGHRG
jgi:tape measure domain-containing protein